MKLKSLRLRELRVGEKSKTGDWIVEKEGDIFPIQTVNNGSAILASSPFRFFRIEYRYPKRKKKQPLDTSDRTHLSRNIDLTL